MVGESKIAVDPRVGHIIGKVTNMEVADTIDEYMYIFSLCVSPILIPLGCREAAAHLRGGSLAAAATIVWDGEAAA